MNCRGEVKQKCGVKIYAPCVSYEKSIPDWSGLSGETCVSAEDTINDLYENVGSIKEEINLSALGQQCLTYVPVGQIPKVKDILKTYEDEICLLKSQILTLQTTAICDANIESCGIDLSGIEDSCNNPIQTLGQLLNYIVTNLQTTP